MVVLGNSARAGRPRVFGGGQDARAPVACLAPNGRSFPNGVWERGRHPVFRDHNAPIPQAGSAVSLSELRRWPREVVHPCLRGRKRVMPTKM